MLFLAGSAAVVDIAVVVAVFAEGVVVVVAAAAAGDSENYIKINVLID